MSEEEIIGFDEDEYTNINLISSDGQAFSIDIETAKQSSLVKVILENDTETTEVSLKNVEGYVLQCIVEYMEYHNGKEVSSIVRPLRSQKFEECVDDKWDIDFINKFDTEKLISLILAANYMDISSLLDLGCAKIAFLLKGKSPTEIRESFSSLTGPSTPS